MENGVSSNGDGVTFSEEEVREMSGLKRADDYVEVMCGCTSHRYGDAVGRLRVFVTGDLEITCECTPGCLEDKLTPAAFEKHSGRETARKWKNNVWVMVNGEKVPIVKTTLLKYYKQASKNASRSHNGRVCHRDEFVCCARCNKERRFRLRTKEECRSYHDALAYMNWKCSDMPYDNVDGHLCVPFVPEALLSGGMLWHNFVCGLFLKPLFCQCSNIVHNLEQHVMTVKNERVGRCTGAAPILQHAEVAPPVYVLDVKSVVFRTAAARLAPTSQGTRKLESKTVIVVPKSPPNLGGFILPSLVISFKLQSTFT
ncbi:unnamed protein product [Ilex paraguariensis]|uniref:SAND domain-containing protein n=1 Tax=Ilex paraguariensis TaxID=185542 RepID=A0ABC8SW28_9AQUA